jgi:hypothetical protein
MIKTLCILITLLAFLPTETSRAADPAKDAARAKPKKIETPPPTHPPLQAIDVTKLPEGVDRLDLFLLMGQSNMKGRGVMPEGPSRDPRIVMMHLRDYHWYVARHPLHLTGDAQTFAGHDNAGVGPGLSFAEALTAKNPQVRIGLIPCAVGGTRIDLWQRGAKLYDEALRRAKLALETTSPVKARIRGVLWLQGEADAAPDRREAYEAKLLKLVDDLRTDLDTPDLPFIACTIGEMRADSDASRRTTINKILLALPEKRAGTACVDAHDLKGNIGDDVHFDTASQTEIGRRFAEKLLRLRQPD